MYLLLIVFYWQTVKMMVITQLHSFLWLCFVCLSGLNISVVDAVGGWLSHPASSSAHRNCLYAWNLSLLVYLIKRCQCLCWMLWIPAPPLCPNENHLCLSDLVRKYLSVYPTRRPPELQVSQQFVLCQSGAASLSHYCVTWSSSTSPLSSWRNIYTAWLQPKYYWMRRWNC